MASSRAEALEAPTVAAPYEPNAILRWLTRRFFAHITIDEAWSGVVRDAAKRGVVVYVLRSVSVLDFLCLDFLVKRFALPLVRFVGDLGLGVLEPFGRGRNRLWRRRHASEERSLSETVRGRHSAILFLRRPPSFATSRHRGERIDVDLLRTLVEAQRTIETPILLVPQTFVWSTRPTNAKRTLLDFIFGPRDWPGKLRVFAQFVLNYRNALLRSGEPFDLAAFVREHPDLTDSQIADRIRWALLRRMERERTLVLGPTQKSPDRMIEEILRSQRLVPVLASAAHRGRRKRDAVSDARKMLRRLAARPSMPLMLWLKRLLDRVWNRIYNGMIVDHEGLERVRAAARRGNLVLLPSHKSHIDYLVLTDVLYSNALSAPLVAAGDNLSFFPLGWMLRRAGAFFIRRAFRGDKLYSAIVDAYIRKVMVEGYSLEFFIEGGRSRSGKLLAPKLGILSMVIDAALALRGRPVFFVPISIGYERIIEQRAYADELRGGDKREENIGALLQTPKILQSRYGRLYLQFGEILSLDALLPADATEETLSPAARRALVQRVAHRVTFEINRVTIVTPASLVAAALLVHRRRGMTHRKLVETATLLVESLRAHGARIADALVGDDGKLRGDVLREGVRLFASAKLVTEHGTGDDAIYAIPEERRIALEYYHNAILHFFVPSALICSVLIAEGPDAIVESLLRERVQALSRAFKYEFMYRADASFDEIFDDALGHMLAQGEIERRADHVSVGDGRPGTRPILYAAMLRTYFESHQIALRALELIANEPMARKEWVRRALVLGDQLYLAGETNLRESLSRAKIESALSALRDLGFVHYASGDVIERGEAFTSVDVVRARAALISRYLDV